MSAAKKKNKAKKNKSNQNANDKKVTSQVVKNEIKNEVKDEDEALSTLIDSSEKIENIKEKIDEPPKEDEIKEETKEVKEEIKTDEIKIEDNKEEESSKTEKEEKKDLIKSENKEITKKDDKPEYVLEMIKKTKQRTYMLFFIIIIILILICLSTFFAIFNLDNTNIMEGINIKDVNISNLSKEEAKQVITDATNKELLPEISFVYGEDYKVTLKPEQIEFNYDIEAAVDFAYKIGREGNIVENNYSIILAKLFGKDVDIAFSYNVDLLNQFVDDMNSKIPGVVVEPTYYIEENKLIVTKGTDGIRVKTSELKEEIIGAIISRSASGINEGYYQEIKIPVENVKASEIDMAKIHSEIYCDPQDAYYELEPYKVYPDKDGIDLAITPQEAQNLVDSENKTEYTFDLKITGAQKTIDDLGTEAFPYLISQFTTKYDASNRNRSTNLKIAAEKINGKVLMPGEEFSFNKIVGKRTVEEGYKDAKIYSDGAVVDGLAGGICQISSTLYNAVLLANLEITERRNHSFTTSYVPAGKDATVVWGTTDFRFFNSRTYPIKIEASVNNGIAEFKIHGMQEETEYEVKIIPQKTRSIPYATAYVEDPAVIPGQQIVDQAGQPGYKVTTYKELRLNGEVVSKEAITNDTYNPMRRIVRVAPGGVPVQ